MLGTCFSALISQSLDPTSLLFLILKKLKKKKKKIEGDKTQLGLSNYTLKEANPVDFSKEV
jgi:hypothetical protein